MNNTEIPKKKIIECKDCSSHPENLNGLWRASCPFSAIREIPEPHDYCSRAIPKEKETAAKTAEKITESQYIEALDIGMDLIRAELKRLKRSDLTNIRRTRYIFSEIRFYSITACDLIEEYANQTDLSEETQEEK